MRVDLLGEASRHIVPIVSRHLRATRRHLVLSGPAGQADQVLVELEPDAVVAVDAWRRDEAPVAAGGLLERPIEAQPVPRQPR
jgi:hypothetical protein